MIFYLAVLSEYIKRNVVNKIIKRNLKRYSTVMQMTDLCSYSKYELFTLAKVL